MCFFIILLTLDLSSNTNRFIVNPKRKCKKHDVAASSFTCYINKNKQKKFPFYISLEREIYLFNEYSEQPFRATIWSNQKNNHLLIFKCFQMYWTKATPQKYSNQSQHQGSFT